jgi:NTP pyrophosphatase (non-canonical NTP hydrolase)
MDRQRDVAAFVAEHGLEAPPTYRLLDLASEVGELAKEAAESTGYGTDPEELAIAEDELGDTLFALLALAAALDVDAGAALDRSLAKYERRLAERDSPSSGEP